jgi:hypothetical protein
MSAIRTDHLLQELQHKIAVVKRKAETRFNGQSATNLLLQPGPGKWSAVQCLEHLNTYGRHYLPALDQVIKKAEKEGSRSHPSFKSSWLGAYFTRLMQPGDDGQLRSTMKSPRDHVPVEAPDVITVFREFQEQQVYMENLLQRAANIDIARYKVPTSLSRFITLSVGETFGFMVAHIQRHVLQAENALAAIAPQRISNS